jgi:shikimate dehydrogenase
MTKVFGIIGDPVAQVRSPEVFNKLFRQGEVDAEMVPLHVKPEGLAKSLGGLRTIENIAGLIITVPHKVAAASLLQSYSERVRLAKSTNVLRPTTDGWEGDLFDGEGFALGLKVAGHQLRDKNYSVVGAGGAGAAISLALLEHGAASVAIWDIDRGKAEELAHRLSDAGATRVFVAQPSEHSDVAINATPIGMKPDDPLPFNLEALRSDALVAEAIMKPPMTRLLMEAKQRGCAIHEGRHMLDNQVAAIWTFFRLPVLT